MEFGNVCETLVPVMTIVGIVIFVIKIAVPVILIVVGMISLVKALMSGKDDEIKKATSSLIKKVAIGLGVYLVVTVVGLLMNLIGANTNWKECANCAFNPFDSSKCYVISEEDTTVGEQQ